MSACVWKNGLMVLLLLGIASACESSKSNSKDGSVDPKADGFDPSITCSPDRKAKDLRFKSIRLGGDRPHHFVAFMDQVDLNGDHIPEVIASLGINQVAGPADRFNSNRIEVWSSTSLEEWGLLTELDIPNAGFGGLVDANQDGWSDIVFIQRVSNQFVLRVLCGQQQSPFFGTDDTCGDKSILLDLKDLSRIADLALVKSLDANGNVLLAFSAYKPNGTTVIQTVKFNLNSGWYEIKDLTTELTVGEQAWGAFDFLSVGLIDDGNDMDLVVTNGNPSNLIDGSPLPQVIVFYQAFRDRSQGLPIDRLWYPMDQLGSLAAKYAQPRRPLIGDIDGDSLADIAVINYGVNDWGNGTPAIFFQAPDQAWEFFGEVPGMCGEPIEGTLVDLDGNCLTDIIGLSSDCGGFVARLQDKARDFSNQPTASEVIGAHRGLILHGDYNLDGKMDLITGSEAGTVQIPFPDGEFAPLVLHVQE